MQSLGSTSKALVLPPQHRHRESSSAPISLAQHICCLSLVFDIFLPPFWTLPSSPGALIWLVFPPCNSKHWLRSSCVESTLHMFYPSTVADLWAGLRGGPRNLERGRSWELERGGPRELERELGEGEDNYAMVEKWNKWENVFNAEKRGPAKPLRLGLSGKVMGLLVRFLMENGSAEYTVDFRLLL